MCGCGETIRARTVADPEYPSDRCANVYVFGARQSLLQNSSGLQIEIDLDESYNRWNDGIHSITIVAGKPHGYRTEDCLISCLDRDVPNEVRRVMDDAAKAGNKEVYRDYEVWLVFARTEHAND